MKGRTTRRRFSLQPCVLPNEEDEEANGHKSKDKDERRPSRVLEENSLPSPKSHYKIVVLGAARVGKSSLISQFLYDSFSPRYRKTVEEMHHVEYDVFGTPLSFNILDTSGAFAFPAMRALSISSSDAFILVFSVVDDASFQELEALRAQVLEVKGPNAPVVIVANKIDLLDQKVYGEDTSSEPPDMHRVNLTPLNRKIWSTRKVVADLSLEALETLITCDWDHGFVASSAKENVNVVQVFKELLTQAKVQLALSPAVRRRRQSLPAAVQLQQLQQLQPVNPKPHGKRNSCTIS